MELEIFYMLGYHQFQKDTETKTSQTSNTSLIYVSLNMLISKVNYYDKENFKNAGTVSILKLRAKQAETSEVNKFSKPIVRC